MEAAPLNFWGISSSHKSALLPQLRQATRTFQLPRSIAMPGTFGEHIPILQITKFALSCLGNRRADQVCGRYVDPDLRGTEFELSEIKIDPIPRRYNIKPTQEVCVQFNGVIVWARWGLIPSWHRGELRDWRASTINARIKEAADKPSFRGPWRRGRCLIPAGGYYEWTGERSPKQPHLFQSAGNEGTLWFAGLVSLWRDLLTCTIVTRAANDCVEPLHDRMPAILDAAEREAWLDGSGDLMLGAWARIWHHSVRRLGVKDEGEGCARMIRR